MLQFCGTPKPQVSTSKPSKPTLAIHTTGSWQQAVELIKSGKVALTIQDQTGPSLLLVDNTWFHIKRLPTDPPPVNLIDFIKLNAPNAKSIKHVME
jgi:hypothetical protein